MDEDSVIYYRERERVELAAAQAAKCEQAQRVHRELARGYAVLANSEPLTR